MIVIRNAEAMARVIANPPDTQIRDILMAHAERLAEYDIEDVAEFIIVQPGDKIDAIEQETNLKLVAFGQFVSPAEILTEHSRWFEVIWILSDDGFGCVLLVSKANCIDGRLLAACRHAVLADESSERTCIKP